jgi:hypothetical protein
MTTVPAVVTPIATESAGCWSNFCTGAGNSVKWCGRQIATAAVAVWNGIQKIAIWAAAFFKRLAFYCAIGIASAITFIKANSVAFIVGASALAAGLLLGLLFARIFGCCNKYAAPPAASTEDASDTTQATSTATEEQAAQATALANAVAAQALEATGTN